VHSHPETGGHGEVLLLATVGRKTGREDMESERRRSTTSQDARTWSRRGGSRQRHAQRHERRRSAGLPIDHGGAFGWLLPRTDGDGAMGLAVPGWASRTDGAVR
jgi:hypothetical protein